MTPAGQILAAEIRSRGPIPFSRFMEVALYHPEHGYYRGGRDPFGAQGDFYTAEQVQPVFGILMRQYARQLRREYGGDGFRVVELGAGREEMAPFFAEFDYAAVDVERGALPAAFCGLIFANEFFDALPVDVFVRRGREFRELRVNFDGLRFVWTECDPAPPEVEAYLAEFGGVVEEGEQREVSLQALRWADAIAEALAEGWLLVIDYGYTSREALRFPSGTLMGYRRHRAVEDVLEEPGRRDITAHVNFSALQARLRMRGIEIERFETLARTILRAGEEDRFASALEAADETERIQRRLQLKMLLYGMGETFRTLLAARVGPK